MDAVCRAADNKQATVLVDLDISAAFDPISLNVLMGHLSTDFGVCCSVASWLQSYLTGRQH
jgi:hypothetical protein